MCKAGQVLSESAASVRDLYQDKHRLMGSHVSIESGHKATISAHQRRVGPPNPKSNRRADPCLLLDELLELDASVQLHSDWQALTSTLTRKGLPSAMHDTRQTKTKSRYHSSWHLHCAYSFYSHANSVFVMWPACCACNAPNLVQRAAATPQFATARNDKFGMLDGTGEQGNQTSAMLPHLSPLARVLN